MSSYDDEQPSPADRVRLVVRQWSDAQLRRAWATSAHGLAPGAAAGPRELAEVAAVREVLLEEWERRHPRRPLSWSVADLDRGDQEA